MNGKNKKDMIRNVVIRDILWIALNDDKMIENRLGENATQEAFSNDT